jgi:hypothetical protein
MRFAAPIIALIAIASATPVSAQDKPAKKAEPSKPVAEPSKPDCSEYGAGFVRINGTGTCVKIGGYVRGQATVR